MKLVVATQNQGKLREIQNYLGDLGWEVIGLQDYPHAPNVVEDGETFADNAILKARAIRDYTGLPSLADDSGLVVDALGGAPGLYSARYAGEDATDADNNKKLIKNLAGVPEEERGAKFISVLAYLEPGTEEALTFEGNCPGIIIDQARGDGGFGYDPHFYLASEEATMAEISLARKNQISHRARALEKLRKYFQTK